MEFKSIFDLNPSVEELNDIRFNVQDISLRFDVNLKNLTKDEYLSKLKPWHLCYDIFMLLSFREQYEEAEKYLNLIPENFRELARNYGSDDLNIPI